MRHLFDGWRSLNWDFWKCFPKHPRMCCTLIWLVVFFFLADTLWFLLTPKDVRKQWGWDD